MQQSARETPVRMPIASLDSVHRLLGQGRSAEQAAELARQLGFQSGGGFAAELERELRQHGTGDSGDVGADDFWPLLADFFTRLGWGRLEHEALHAGVLSLSSTDWAEADDRSSTHPSCHISTGVLAELLSRLAGTDLAVMEVECRAAGDHRCRFLAGGPQALELVYESLRQGRTYDDALAQLA